jgi:hypothetical protein
LYINKLRVAGVLEKPVNAYFESVSAVDTIVAALKTPAIFFISHFSFPLADL